MEIDFVSPPPAIVVRRVSRGEIGGETPPGLLAPEGLDVGRVVALAGEELVYADHRIIEHAYSVLGILEESTVSGRSPRIQRQGIFSNPVWNWGLGLDLLFLGEAGQLTSVPPAIGFLMPFATVMNQTKINIEMGNPWLYA